MADTADLKSAASNGVPVQVRGAAPHPITEKHKIMNEPEYCNSEGKEFMLRFLPYLEADSIIGYTPAWVKRGYGYGSWEEFFKTRDEASVRMKFLVTSKAVENIELRQEIPGAGMCTRLLDCWNDQESFPSDNG